MTTWQAFESRFHQEDGEWKLILQLREKKLVSDSFEKFVAMSPNQLARSIKKIGPALLFPKSAIQRAKHILAEAKASQPSEYEGLSAKITGLIKRGHLKRLEPDKLPRKHIEFLKVKTGLQERRIKPFVGAVALSNEWNIPLEPLYGLVHL